MSMVGEITTFDFSSSLIHIDAKFTGIDKNQHLDHPSAVSRIIIMVKPKIAPIVAISIFSLL